MKVTALNKTIIVRPLYLKSPKSGIIIPDTAKKYKKYDAEVVGEVVAVSKKSMCVDDAKCGDLLLFQRHEGKPINIEGIEHRAVQDRWVMGLVTGKDAEALRETHAPMRI